MKANHCVLDVKVKEKLVDEINKRVGSNETMRSSVLALILDAKKQNVLNDNFVNFIKTTYSDEEIGKLDFDNLNGRNIPKIARFAIDYLKKKINSVSDTAKDSSRDSKVNTFKYTSVKAREEGKEHIATLMLDALNYLQNNNLDIPKDAYNYFKTEVQNRFLNFVFKNIATKNDISEALARQQFNDAQIKGEYIISALGGRGFSITTDNIIALYEELFSKTQSDSYIREIFGGTKVADVYARVKSEIIDIAQQQAAEEDTVAEAKNDTVVIDTNDLNMDETMGKYENRIGIYTSFMTHIGARVKNYFNTLRKQKSHEQNDYVTENYFGFPETMDANACSSILYNKGRFENVSTMIQSIEDIAKNVPGFECFAKFAQDLRDNLDFATEVYTSFSKTKMRRVETTLYNGDIQSHRTNPSSDARTALMYNVLGDLDSSLLGNDDNVLLKYLTDIDNKAKNLKDDIVNGKGTEETYKAALLALNAKLITVIRQYIPNIESKAITAYIDLYNSPKDILGKLKNLSTLTRLTKTIIDKAPSIKAAYNEDQAMIDAITERNRLMRENHKWVTYEQEHEADALINKNYTDSLMSDIMNIVDSLLPYSVVQTQFNSRNIYGNNTSDIINTSWVTRFNDLLSKTRVETINGIKVGRNEELEAWGRRKLRSNQYRYSNIMLEERDDKGIITRRGLFRYIDDGFGHNILTITPYAGELLKPSLMNGAANRDDSKFVSYADMTRPDFVPTSFMQFFNTVDRVANNTIGRHTDFNIATYFMRTPSDATNIFTLQAPRYSTKGLIQISNIPEIQAAIDKLIVADISKYAPEGSNLISISDYANFNEEGKPITSELRGSLRDYIRPDSERGLMLSDIGAIKYIDDNKTQAYVLFYDENTGYLFVRKGRINKTGNSTLLRDSELVGVANTRIVEKKSDTEKQTEYVRLESIPEEIYNIYYDYYYKQLKENKIEGQPKFNYVINRKHKMFNMLKRQFKQEMVDAAQAIAHYFALEEDVDGGYTVKHENGQPVFLEDKKNNIGYKFYHLGKDGTVYKEVKDKLGNKWIVLDGGNAFHSTKFTFSRSIKNENGTNEIVTKNYFEHLIDESVPTEVNDGVVNFLYGRGIRINGTTDSKTGDFRVSDVTFSSQLDENVNQALETFIIDYIDRNTQILSQYEDFIQNTEVNEDTISEFTLNQFLTFCTYDEFFEGNTKFYKDAQTVLKRAKEYEASGVPYGISDLLYSHNDNLSDIEGYSFLNDGYIMEPIMETITDEKGKTKTQQKKDENGVPMYEKKFIQGTDGRIGLFTNTIFDGVKQRNGFRAVTIKNSIKTNRTVLDRLVKKLVDDCNLTKERAETLLYGPIEYDEDGNPIEDKEHGGYLRKGGFSDSKVNDAQSYITVQEWVRRIAARGQLQRYLPLIKKLTDPTAVLNAKDIKEFVQVQKNIYYDLYYDERYGIEVPRQIKNAEFVLVPQLIKGTELEVVYNLMNELDINQLNTVETSKASNEELLSLWDNDGNLTEKNIESFRDRCKAKNSPVAIYSYNNLYTQQETPQHMNAENKAGIQIVKKLMDNLPDGDSRKEKFFRLFSANIKESFENILKQFEIPLDENGNIALDEEGHIKGLNKKVFYAKLREEMIRTGMDNNLVDYVTMSDDNDQPIMPSAMNNVITKFEQVVQSMFNNAITRQKLPGFHAPQVTNIGWSNMSETLPEFSKKQLLNSSKWKEFAATVSDEEIKWTSNKDDAKLDGDINNKDSIKGKFKKYIEETSPTYARRLEYHPVNKETGKVESYIEVMVPLSYLGIDRNAKAYKGKTDAQILEDLKKEKLDEFIGYRIPTEGKQSVCIMKVVGVLDDSYGSTIVVPDEWVAQTGSDFDVDSIYTIQYETRRNNYTGKISRINYKTYKELTYEDYLNYADAIVKEIGAEDASAKKKEKENELKTDLNKRWKLLSNEEHKLFGTLSEKVKKLVRAANDKIDAKYSKISEEGKVNKKEIYIERLGEIIESIEPKIKASEKAKAQFIKTNQAKNLETTEQYLANLLAYKKGLEDILAFVKDESPKDKRKEIEDEYIATITKTVKQVSAKAKEYGLMTYEEFTSKENEEIANTREARNTAILQKMIEILDSDEALEENLSRSNFDDITYWRNELMSKYFTDERKGRSAYDWYDQAKFQEDAMSGAKLKAASVSMDTFCSVCNTIRPILTSPIKVVYNIDTVEDPDGIKERYDVKSTNKKFLVSHEQFGWSKDNKNAAGRILTAYSSQTTAYILDAVKEGSLPNVNMYTFNVFKLFPNLGCDYRTALSFIMQPAITKIVQNNNNNASIFSNSHENPIEKAIRDIATELGIADIKRSTSIATILKQINENEIFKKQFNKYFNITEDGNKKEDINISLQANLPIDVDLYIDRLKGRGEFGTSTPIEERRLRELIFDLGVAIQFNRFHSVAYNIGNIARCCNPDKFGAKQTVYATRKVFEDINDAIWGQGGDQMIDAMDLGEIQIDKKRSSSILVVPDKDNKKESKFFLEAIYPGLNANNFTSSTDLVNTIARTNSKDSAYPTLFNFLKYSTATSVIIARTLFETEHESFTRIIDGFKHVLNGYKNTLTDETYTDVKKYVLTSMYNSIPSIKYPVRVKVERDKKGNVTTNGIEIIPQKDANEAKKVAAEERERIYGFNHKPDLSIRKVIGQKTELLDDGTERVVDIQGIINFDVADINKPTDEEINDFMKLSPAQKVKFIKSKFYDAGIFEYITPTLYIGKGRGFRAGSQTIEYIADNVDTNTIYSLFKEAMFNNNPLIVLTAIDMVKYGVQVEGLRLTQRGISKTIDNDAFINTLEDGGLNFVNELRRLFNDGTTQGVDINGFTIENVYENYLRSHPETKGIRKIWLNSKNKVKYKLDDRQCGIYYLTTDTTIEDEGDRIEEFRSRLESMGIIYKLPGKDSGYANNKYLRLIENNTSRLYKIVTDPQVPTVILLHPLGELMENEVAYASVNDNYNKGLNDSFILDSEGYKMVCTEIFKRSKESTFGINTVKSIIDEVAKTNWLSSRTVQKYASAIAFNMQEEINNGNEGMNIAQNQIIEWFENPMTKERPLFIRNNALNKFITSEGDKNGSTQTIEINGIKRQFRIALQNNRRQFGKEVLQGDESAVEQMANNPSLYNIVKTARQNNEQVMWNLFVVKPVTDAANNVQTIDDEDIEETYQASIEEASSRQITYAISQRATYNDPFSTALLEKFRIRGISEKESVISGNLDYVIRELAAYATNTADSIKTDLFDKFIKIPGTEEEADTFISITDPRALDYIRKDAALAEKFMKAINLANSFIKRFSESETATYKSSDPTIKHRIDDIVAAVEKIKALPINELEHKFSQVMADKHSTNPLIKMDFIDVCDAYWRTEGLWKFTDIMDNGTPLLQIFLKDVAGDIDAKRKHTSRVLKAYWDKINDIKKRAAARGFTINVDKLVDEHGRFVRDYNSKFIDKLDELRQKRDEAQLNVKENATLESESGFIEYLKAKLEYDIFKGKHVNQPARQDYYIRKARLEHFMLYGGVLYPEDITVVPTDSENPTTTPIQSEAFPEIFAKYTKLVYEKMDIYTHQSVNGFTAEDAKRLNEIDNEIYMLRGPQYVDNNDPAYTHYTIGDVTYEREHYDPSRPGTPEELERIKIYSYESVKALNTYCNAMDELQKVYFGHEEAFGFREELNRNLQIIITAEDRDAQGVPQRSQLSLNNNKEYIEAKNWIRQNARFEIYPVPGRIAEEDGESLAYLLSVAASRVKFGRNGKPSEANRIMRTHDDNKGIHDEKGIPDGRLLNDEEKEKIKEAQREAWHVNTYPPFSDRKLITNALPDDYPDLKAEFYNNMSGNTEKSATYIATITEINNLLTPYYNSKTQIVNLSAIPDTEEGIQTLNRLAELYQTLRECGHGNVDFIEENVEFKTNEALYNQQGREMAGKSDDYKTAMMGVIFDYDKHGRVVYKRDAEGNIILNANGRPAIVGNRYLYGYAVPKGTPGTPEYDKWIEPSKPNSSEMSRKKAMEIINDLYRRVPTIYYELEKKRMLDQIDMILNDGLEGSARRAQEYYEDWYTKNHVYNPFTRACEPIACWTKSEIKTERFEGDELSGRWIAVGKQRERKVNDGTIKEIVRGETLEYYDEDKDMRNPKYKPGATNLENYHAGDPEYDSNVELNPFEQELSKYLQEVLMENSTIDKTQRYFSKGWAPRIAKSENDAFTPLKELLKLISGGDVSASKNDWAEQVGAEHDFIVDPPMTQLLKDKRSTDYVKRQTEANNNLRNIDKMTFSSIEEKNKYQAEQESIIEDCKKHLQEINDSLLNRDWVTVIAEYLNQISRYNAILDNKNKIYFLRNMLQNMNMIRRDPLTNKYLVDNHRGNKDNPVYVETPDRDLIDQYDNYIRRLLFDQWHERSAMREIADRLQTFTSANYMMLNVRGGIANVTLGITGILGEAAAKEALGVKDWNFGVAEWHKGVISYARRGFHIERGEPARYFSKQDAIIQYFDVVDYDEITGIVKETGIKEYSKKIRNLMFSPQSIGEHFMQNSVLFGMLHSHKLITDEDGEVTFMTESQYIQLKQQQALEDILNEEQLSAFNAFKEEIKSDKQKMKKYVEFRRNLLTDFIYLHCTKEQEETFKKRRKEIAEQAKTEFSVLPNMYDQLELSEDGQLKFVDGSMLAELDTKLNSNLGAITKAERLCAEFAEKVRKTNNRIHGNYNRDGRAYIEKYWWGSLLMQYHKHLPMGILKRYLRKGHWDETRGTVMKGMWESFYDLLNLNFRKIRVEAGLTDDEVGALEAFSYTLMHMADYLKQISSTIAIMPEYDIANLRRNVGDLIGVVSAMATVAALWYVADDDEEMQESIWFNMALYEADRLASEAFMYNPYGLFVEGKKLMSTPVAAQSIVTDALNTTLGIINWMTDDEYDPYYHSGRFSNKPKLQVWIERRIPMYNGIRSILDTPDANHYYKLGQNPIGLFNVKDWVTNKEN